MEFSNTNSAIANHAPDPFPVSKTHSFTAEEVSSVYQRWQQMEKQYGQQAHSMPEYVQLTQYLRAAARFKQQQQQQQAARNASPLSNASPTGNDATQFQRAAPPNGQPQRPMSQQHQQQHQQQQQPQHHQQAQSPPQHVPSNQQHRPQTSNIFSEMESMLLKAQITAFKSLINNQPIPVEISHFIQNNLRLPQQQQQQQQPAQLHKQQSPVIPQSNIPLQSKRPYQKRKSSAKQISRPPSVPNQLSQQAQLPPQQVQHQVQQQQQPPPPQQHAQQISAQISRQPQRAAAPPVKFSHVSSQFQNIKSVIQVDDPTLQVESYSVPLAPKNVTFDLLNSASSRIILPSLFPEPLDISAASEVKKLVDNLTIDYTLQELSKSKDQDLESLIDYESLKLLPLQKAVRGQIINVLRHQNSLLTNTHPNFLAKTRAITANDIYVTNNLYEQQLRIAARIEHSKKIEKLNIITESSMKWIDSHSTTTEKYAKLGRSLALFHAATEREEQKRVERNAKQRLQALKANDEEAYIKLLDQTKDTRITHLLKQTNSFLGTLAQAVKEQQKDTAEKLVASGHVEAEKAEEEENEDEDSDNIDYYSVAHRIQETVTKQPEILIGGTLKEYQIKGLQWMVSLFNNHLNGILADEMGLGKTIQTISLLTYLVEVKKIPGPFLVIVPLSTLTNWNLEFEKWAPSLKKITYKGVPAHRKAMQHDIKAQNFQVLLTTFEYIIKDRPLLSKIKWVYMIMDEGHRLKNSASKLSSTLTYYYHSDYRLILTGTPLQNNLPELWAILNFVLPKIFNSVKSFDEWFNTPFANTGTQEKIELSEEETLLVIRRLHKVLRPFLLRRLKKDVEKDLPDKVEKVVKCRMSALQGKLYQQMLRYNKLFCEGDDKKPVEIKGLNNQLMQLRKICNHPFVFGEVEKMIIGESNELNHNIWRVSGKFELLDRVLPKFKATGHRVLIFFQMTQVMDIMEDFLSLRDMKFLRLDGSTKADDRQDMLKVFNAPDSEYFAFLLSTRAGGLGLNLQTADTVIIFDSDWNPHQDLQAQDRAHRIGQKNEVRILRLITEDSIEEMILERAHQKLDIDGKVIQAGKFDNKSTAEEQEALLRALIEAEENKKADKDGDDEMNDNELNEVLARSDQELQVFKSIDEERLSTPFGKNRLFTDQELPSIYHQDPEIVFKEEEDNTIYGRGARERKATVYDEALSEAQWLKEIEMSSDDGDDDSGSQDEDFVKSKARSRKRKARSKTPSLEAPLPPRKRKNASSTNLVANDDDFIVNDEEVDGIAAPVASKRVKTGGKRSIKSNRRGESKSNTPISRVASTVNKLDPEQRKDLQFKMLKIYDTLFKFQTGERRLSDIFAVKPLKKSYPSYYQIIKFPMAFDMINKRINKSGYNDIVEFMEDIHLMFVNAKTYNQEGSMVYHDAITLEKLAIEKYKELTGEPGIDFTEYDSANGLRSFPDVSVDSPASSFSSGAVNEPTIINELPNDLPNDLPSDIPSELPSETPNGFSNDTPELSNGIPSDTLNGKISTTFETDPLLSTELSLNGTSSIDQ